MRLNACDPAAPCTGKFINLVLDFLLPARFPLAVRAGEDGEKGGRSMGAVEDIDAGVLLFACRAAHVSLYCHGRKRLCAACFGSRQTPFTLRCSSCDAVYYCSEACASHHRSRHASVCVLMRCLRKYELNKKGRGTKGLDKVSHEMFQGLALLLLALQVLPSSTKDALEALQEETANWNDVQRSDYGAVARCAVSFLREVAGWDIDQSVAEQWLSRMHLNSFALGNNFGALMFSTMSFFNHGCEPNATTIPIDDCQYLFAARPIKAGEEVLTHYIDLEQPVQIRRKQLMQSFRFHCECERCCRESRPSGKKAQKNGRVCEKVKKK